MNNLLRAGWVLFFILFVWITGTAIYNYRKQSVTMQTHLENKEKIVKLENEQKMKAEWKAEEKKDIEKLKKLAREHGRWWFLHDIEEQLGPQFKPLFESIGPMKLTNERDYVYMSRNIVIEGTYPEIIKLFGNLEKDRGFSIEELSISKLGMRGDEFNLEQINKASFILSSVEVKKDFMDELVGLERKQYLGDSFRMESLLLPALWNESEALVLKYLRKDPFAMPSGNTVQAVKDKVSILPPIDLSARYRLEGIVNFPLYKLAIIGPDYILKEGDWLEDKQVISISEEKITFKAGKQEYFLSVPAFDSDSEQIKTDTLPELEKITQEDLKPNRSEEATQEARDFIEKVKQEEVKLDEFITDELPALRELLPLE